MACQYVSVVERERLTRDWYREYYGKRGADRNNLRTNRGVLFQTLAMEASLVRAARVLRADPGNARILDVGCGSAVDLYQLFRLGCRPENLIGIDILADRLAGARAMYPQARFLHGDASQMEFADGTFDIVYEGGMFATLPDDVLCAEIASEMVRVCKPRGELLLVDWWMPKPFDPNYRSLTRKRLRRLFAVGSRTALEGVFRGALVPPVGRFLSAYAPWLYFSVAALLPFLVGQVTYVLRKH
jgi:ubiquinone/menaquinone biosynthesis C-methylase UbiE